MGEKSGGRRQRWGSVEFLSRWDGFQGRRLRGFFGGIFRVNSAPGDGGSAVIHMYYLNWMAHDI